MRNACSYQRGPASISNRRQASVDNLSKPFNRYRLPSLSVVVLTFGLILVPARFAAAIEVDDVVGQWTLSLSDTEVKQNAMLEIRQEGGELQGDLSSDLGERSLISVRIDDEGLAIDYGATLDDEPNLVHLRLRPDEDRFVGYATTNLNDEASRQGLVATRPDGKPRNPVHAADGTGELPQDARRLPAKGSEDYVGSWRIAIGFPSQADAPKLSIGLIIADVDGKIVVAIKTADGVQRTMHDVRKTEDGLRWTYEMNFGMVIAANMDVVKKGDELRVTVAQPQQEVFLAGSAIRVDDANQLGMDEEQIRLVPNLEHIGSYAPGTRLIQTKGERIWLQQGRRLMVLHSTDPLLMKCERGYFPQERTVIGVDGSRASVFEWRTNSLVVYDISDPTSSVPLGLCEIPTKRPKAFLGHDSLFIAIESSGEDSNHKAHILDVSDQLGPIVLGSSESMFGAQIYDLKAYDSQLFVATGSGLSIFDLTNPESPEPLGRVKVGTGAARGVDVVGTTAFVANSMHSDASWLVLLDISDPASPKKLAEYPTGGGAQDVVVSDSTAFVADRSNGILLVDISDPADLRPRGHVRTKGHANDVSVAGKLVFVKVRDDRDSLEVFRFDG